MRILIVEDETAIRENLSDLLQRDGVEVVTVSDGLEGYKLLKQSPFDLMITDYQMPRLSGLDLIRVLRKEKLLIPAICLTGRDHAELRMQAWELGLYDYIEKSANMGEIFESIESFIALPATIKNQLMHQFMVDAFQIPFPVIATKIHKTSFRGLMDWGKDSNLDPYSVSKMVKSES